MCVVDVYYANYYDRHEKPRGNAIGGNSRQTLAGTHLNPVVSKTRDITKVDNKQSIEIYDVAPIAAESKLKITGERCLTLPEVVFCRELM